MLLGSPHFANFLNEMPDNTVPPQIQAQQQQQQQQPQQIQVSKDANAPRTQEFQMQQNPQVSMVMVPNQGMDTSIMNNGGWNSGIDMNYGNTPVFAVLEVPEGPALDIEALSGKSSSSGVSEHTKDEVPVLDRPECTAPSQKSDIGTVNPDVKIDESDPAFALFVDSPASAPSDDLIFDGVQNEKSTTHFELVVDNTRASIATQARFSSLCSSIEAAFERVSLVTSHLQ